MRDFVQGIFDPVRDGVAEGKLPSIRDLVATGAENLKANKQLKPAERVDLTLMFSQLADDVGDRSAARDLAAAAGSLAARTLDRLDPLAIQALEQNGSLAIRSGDYAAGEPALREARDRLEATRTGGMSLVNVLDNLAVIEMDRDRTEAALALEQQALDERIRTFGAEAREIAGGYNNLGYGLEGAGRFDEAAAAYQRAYEIDLKFRQPDSYDVLTGLSNWGWTLVRAGRLHRAAELLARAQADLDKIGGKPRIMNILNAQKLCAVETMLADIAAADHACAQMLQLTAQLVGEADATYADSLRLEAGHLLESGRLAPALAAAQRGWDLYGDSAESRSRRGALLRTRAEIEWLQGNAAAARDDALAARSMMAAVPDVPALLALDGIAVLACSRAPAQACPADLESAFATKLQSAATNTPSAHAAGASRVRATRVRARKRGVRADHDRKRHRQCGLGARQSSAVAIGAGLARRRTRCRTTLCRCPVGTRTGRTRDFVRWLSVARRGERGARRCTQLPAALTGIERSPAMSMRRARLCGQLGSGLISRRRIHSQCALARFLTGGSGAANLARDLKVPRAWRPITFEPAENVGDLGHHVARLLRDLVTGVGHADHHRRHLAQFQRFVELFGVRTRRAVIDFAGHQHRRRLDVADIRERRALHVVVLVVPRHAGEPVLRAERRQIGRQHQAVPVDDRFGDDGRARSGRCGRRSTPSARRRRCRR